MTTTTARLGLILEQDGAKYAMPIGGLTAIIALIGFIVPSGMGIALAVIGTMAGLLASLTWLHLQVVGLVIVSKIVTDSFLWLYNGGNEHDYYNE